MSRMATLFSRCSVGDPRLDAEWTVSGAAARATKVTLNEHELLIFVVFK